MPVLEVIDAREGDVQVRGDLSDGESSGDPSGPEAGAPCLSVELAGTTHPTHAYSGIMTYPGMQRVSEPPQTAREFLVTGAFDPAELPAVANFRDRLLWAIKFRETNQLQLARKAGFKSPAHVNRILKRAESNPDAQVEIRTATLLARALDISLHWLQTGEGQRYPFEPYFNLDDPFPNRQRAAWAHALIGTDSRAIAEVVDKEWGDAKDPTAKVWFKRIELAEEQLLRGD